MSPSRCLTAGLLLSWLLTVALLPAAGSPEAAEPTPETAAQGLASAPVDLRLPPPLDLRFQTMDLRFPVEDIKGAVQALAVKETPTEVKIELAGDVLFDFDKADIRSEAEVALRRVVELIKQHPRSSVAIDGYTDGKGVDAYNLRLSDKRAMAVKDWLARQGGIDVKRMKARGWGRANPVAPNTNPDGSDNPEGRQKNRRVEITVKK